MSAITLCLKKDEARQHIRTAKRRGKKVGVVPTMGALHQGHLSLVKACSSDCDFSVVTVFVNPTQFGPNEDFEHYPRNLDADLAKLEDLGVDLVFAPDPAEMYSSSHSCSVRPPRVAEPLEGKLRPGHFEGVTTVVLKLFHIIPADVAFLGQKDYQQTRVIKDMVQELDLPMCIQVCPIIRESDGLALSSRNAYMSHDERMRAVSLSQALRKAVELSRGGETNAENIQRAMIDHLRQAGIENIDYAVLVDGQTLQSVEHATPGTIALIAAYVGKTRLIDNVQFS